MSKFKEFKEIVKSLDYIWNSDNVYFSQMQNGYSACYAPEYPYESRKDVEIYWNGQNLLRTHKRNKNMNWETIYELNRNKRIMHGSITDVLSILSKNITNLDILTASDFLEIVRNQNIEKEI